MSTADQTTTKLGSQVQVGDIIMFLSHPHRVTRIEPYEGPNSYLWDGQARIAKAGPGPDAWGIILDPMQRYDVA